MLVQEVPRKKIPMATLDDFIKYLKQYKCEKSQAFTHTSIDNPKGKYYIPDEKLDEFLTVYKRAVIHRVPLHMTEKPKPLSPMRIDLDFRFVKPEDKLPRLYTIEHVHQIVLAYCKVIVQYIDIHEPFKAYIMEKPAPTDHRGKVKDGLHIVFPEIVCQASFQHLVRKQILDNAETIFKDIPVCNSFTDVIDEAIIEHNNWQMYGSTKPGCATYKVTHVLKFNPDINENDENNKNQLTDCPELTPEEEFSLSTLLSMRNKTTETPIRTEKRKEVDEYVRFVLPTNDDRRKNKLHSQILGLDINYTNNKASDDDFKFAKDLVMRCLKYERAERYDDWIKLGWCLRNIDYNLMDTWIEFSKMSSKYVEGEGQNLWAKMRNATLGMGTLRWWARMDNAAEYDKIISSNAMALVDKCIATEGAHYDVARVIHCMYKDKFRHTVKEIWYMYDENKHKWIKTRDANRLRKLMSEDVCNVFLQRGLHWHHESMVNEDNREAAAEKTKKLNKIAERLRNSGYKSSVMKECECMFTDEKFEDLLDSHPHLIGFENGVYDLRLHEFRDGMPDDYVSFGTNNHYFPYNKDSIEAKELEQFFCQIYTNPNVRKYALDIFATVLDGGIKMEKFYVMTGSSSNGKSKVFELIQKAIGDYYSIMPISLITQKRAASNAAAPELERTKGRRMAVMQEPGESEKLNTGLMKELTGGDRIQARGLFKEPIEFRPQFKMFLVCNDLPDVPSDDGGTWRRIRVIEHTSKFCENPDPSKPNQFAMDVELDEKINRWASVFMSMLIDHHSKMMVKNIAEPMEVRIATESYKKNNDIVGQFKDECTEVTNDPDKVATYRLKLAEIHVAFKRWSNETVAKGKKIPERNQLRAYFENMLGKYPTNNKGWKGIRLKVLDNEEDSDAEEE